MAWMTRTGALVLVTAGLTAFACDPGSNASNSNGNQLTRPVVAVPSPAPTDTHAGPVVTVPSPAPTNGDAEEQPAVKAVPSPIPATIEVPRAVIAPNQPSTPALLPCRESSRRAPSVPASQTQSFKTSKVALTVKIQRKTYLASGCTSRQLEDSAVSNIPRKPAEGTTGLTEWGTSLDYTFSQKTTTCALESATIVLSIVVSVPEAATRAGLTPQELTKWDAEVERIRAHEEHHVDIDLKGAKKLQSALGQLGTSAKCADVEKAIKATTDKITDQVKQENKAFDVADAKSHLGGPG